MALGTPSESPAVVVREIDLTGGVPNVQSTTGAIAGRFNWGPINVATKINNEAELVDTFSAPTADAYQGFLSASQFLRYSSSLYVTRAAESSASNAYALNGTLATGDSIDVTSVWDFSQFSNSEATIVATTSFDSVGVTADANIAFMARYAGTIGNSIKVSVLHAGDSDTQITDTYFDNWAYSSEFDAKPATSLHAATESSQNDELHVVVIDEDGAITGTKGTVLERFGFVSSIPGAKNSQGQSVYAKDVINNGSQYVYMFNFTDSAVNAGAGITITASTDYGTSGNAINYSLVSGDNGSSISLADLAEAYDTFADKDQIEIDFLISPSSQTREGHITIVNDLVAKAEARKDCVVVASPSFADVIGVNSDATKVTNTVTTAAGYTRSSYLVADNNFIKIYDKYNDAYRNIPASSTVAGIMAATDINRAAWFSPAGNRRGQLLGITALAYSPTKGQRDTLYKAGINPIANIPGQGALLFGDKTFLGRVSAFDRINVRRLFLILERAIGRAAEQVLFEFNDEFTRAEFVNIVEPVLREVQGRRGITDFRVVCDETNNTAEIIDRNEFKADIFIKPARSINYVTLSFVAVRTGVDFEEVVGTV
jgi:hypothetical protein